jgi:hypothetical protein
MGRPKLDRKADCHPDRPHRARGLCASCYFQEYQKDTRPRKPVGETFIISSWEVPPKDAGVSPWDCMTPDEWALWTDANVRGRGLVRAKYPCTDCPLWFSNEMKAENRCNGVPRGDMEEVA